MRNWKYIHGTKDKENAICIHTQTLAVDRNQMDEAMSDSPSELLQRQ